MSRLLRDRVARLRWREPINERNTAHVFDPEHPSRSLCHRVFECAHQSSRLVPTPITTPCAVCQRLYDRLTALAKKSA